MGCEVPVYCMPTESRQVHGTLKKLGELALTHETLGGRCCSPAKRQQRDRAGGIWSSHESPASTYRWQRVGARGKVVCSNRWPLR